VPECSSQQISSFARYLLKVPRDPGKHCLRAYITPIPHRGYLIIKFTPICVYALSSLRGVAFILAQPSEIDGLLGEACVLQQHVQRYRNNFRDPCLPCLLVNQVLTMATWFSFPRDKRRNHVKRHYTRRGCCFSRFYRRIKQKAETTNVILFHGMRDLVGKIRRERERERERERVMCLHLCWLK